MLRTALALAKRKLHVFPCLERAKTPAVAWGFRAATVDPQIIRGWWGARPDCNVAIATGAISGVFVVDVDGVDGEFELRRLEAEHDTLPSTVEVITGAGRHLYFRMPEMPVRNSAGKVADNIDVRGDGGYVLVPPSIHPSGRAYTWSVTAPTCLQWHPLGCSPRPAKQPMATRQRRRRNGATSFWAASAKAGAIMPSPASRATCCAAMSIRWWRSNF